MAKKIHWLSAIASEIKERMAASIDDIAAGLIGDAPFGDPQVQADETGHALETFLQADPETRQAFLSSIPPERYAEVTGKLMSEANHRFGPAARALQPIFEGGQTISALQQLAAQQAQPNLGVAAAFADLTDLIGVDPLAPTL